ncbi:hypothetical protein DRW41_06735 [Neobacillus piezotolerans]|uniref:Uncharacterized protein n=1 Tax=Neobacillus piezotolerans TaxID=2259171 RepID=A0A3D8GST4_9BACI|nr:hypothetical protein [Neobacillus piezotolerans]RDU37534.1 hypothetical protein DRW41_06735 [Neobacillus piezotolerans]
MDRNKSNVAESLELLIESLIRMTGKTNEHVSSLHSRIRILEDRLAEHENEWKQTCSGCPVKMPQFPLNEDSRFLFRL